MASSGKKKTTMAKLMRESRLRERRMDKAARKDARKSAAAADLAGAGDATIEQIDELAQPDEHGRTDEARPAREGAAPALTDA